MILYQLPIFFQSSDHKVELKPELTIKSQCILPQNKKLSSIFFGPNCIIIQEPWESSHSDQPGCLLHEEFNTLLGRECAGPRNDGEEAEGKAAECPLGLLKLTRQSEAFQSVQRTQSSRLLTCSFQFTVRVRWFMKELKWPLLWGLKTFLRTWSSLIPAP